MIQYPKKKNTVGRKGEEWKLLVTKASIDFGHQNIYDGKYLPSMLFCPLYFVSSLSSTRSSCVMTTFIAILR